MKGISGNVVRACVRSATTALGVVALIGGVFPSPAPIPAVPRPAILGAPGPRENGFGNAQLAAGERAAERGEYRQADIAYRIAWADPDSRRQAAAALAQLHRSPGFALDVDEAAVTLTRRALGGGFRRFDTPHFVILSDCSSDWTQSRGDLLERARSQFFRVAERMGVPATPHRVRLMSVLFNDHARYQAFAQANDGLDAGWVAGYYATLSNRIVFYNDASSPVYEAFRDRLSAYETQLRDARTQAEQADLNNQNELAQRLHATANDLDQQIQRERTRLGERASAHSTAKTVHEAIHLLSFNCGLQLADRDYPFWLSEGLATAFETDRPQDSFGPDRPSTSGSRRDRFEDLRRQGRFTPLAELITIAEVPTWDADTADAMYSQSYALFTMLYKQDPTALGAYFRDISSEPIGHLSAARQIELFTRHFGDLDVVEKRFRRGH